MKNSATKPPTVVNALAKMDLSVLGIACMSAILGSLSVRSSSWKEWLRKME